MANKWTFDGYDPDFYTGPKRHRELEARLRSERIAASFTAVWMWIETDTRDLLEAQAIEQGITIDQRIERLIKGHIMANKAAPQTHSQRHQAPLKAKRREDGYIGIDFSIKTEARDLLEAQASEQGVTIGECIDQLIKGLKG